MRRVNADLVAFVLALSLGLTLALIALSTVINVFYGRNPYPTLGENTTQVMTTVMGGIIGLLGTYIGSRVQRNRQAEPGAASSIDPAAHTEVLVPKWPGEEKK